MELKSVEVLDLLIYLNRRFVCCTAECESIITIYASRHHPSAKVFILNNEIKSGEFLFGNCLQRERERGGADGARRGEINSGENRPSRPLKAAVVADTRQIRKIELGASGFCETELGKKAPLRTHTHANSALPFPERAFIGKLSARK
jgi:hypothetical protein